MSMSKPHIAILGAGPTGLEAALAAAEGGLAVHRSTRRRPTVAGNVRAWGHVRLFTPWEMNVSPRMRRHLEAAGRESRTAPNAPPATSSPSTCSSRWPRCRRSRPTCGSAPACSPSAARACSSTRRSPRAERGPAPLPPPPRRRLRPGVDRDGGRRDRRHRHLGQPQHPGRRRHPRARASARSTARSGATSPTSPREAADWAGKTVLLAGAGHSAQTAVRDARASWRRRRRGREVIWALRNPEPGWGTHDGRSAAGPGAPRGRRPRRSPAAPRRPSRPGAASSSRRSRSRTAASRSSLRNGAGSERSRSTASSR